MVSLPAWPTPSRPLRTCSLIAVIALAGDLLIGPQWWIGPIPVGLWVVPALVVLVAFSRARPAVPGPGPVFWVPALACLAAALVVWASAGLSPASATAVLVVAAAEEALFRVALLVLVSASLSRLSAPAPAVIAIVVSSAAFALMPGHLETWPTGPIVAFVFALTLATITTVMGRVGPAIVVHATCNLVSIAALQVSLPLFVRPALVAGTFGALYLAYRRVELSALVPVPSRVRT